jgi:hypothetical protein
MFTNDPSDTTHRRRRIIQAPVRTEPPIALIGDDGRALPELEALLKRRHPLICFPSLSHFLAAPPERQAWAAIVMARPGAWDVRLDRYVTRRRRIALFAQPEEGYGWPEEVARVRDSAELGPWLERLDAPEPARTTRKSSPRAPRAQAPAPQTAAAPSWLERDAPVWDALASASALATPAAEPAAAQAIEPAPRRSPEQLALANIVDAPVRRTQKPKPVRQRAPATAPRQPTRRAKPTAPAPSQPESLAQHSAALVRSLLSEKRPPDVRGELAFMRAAAEVGLVRAEELLQQIHARAARLA